MEAVDALVAAKIPVVPIGDEWEHWQIGNLIFSDDDLWRLAASRGLVEHDQEVTAAPPPWREVTPDDYHPRIHEDSLGGSAYITAGRVVHKLLQDQLDGKHRLRLVLREAVDLAGRDKKRQTPYWLWAYDHGVSMILSAAEVVIEMRSGKRHVVRMVRNAEDARNPGGGWADGVPGGIAPGPWLRRPIPTR
ncbi:hypothetical protein [Methylobacterium sp. P5_C11]